MAITATKLRSDLYRVIKNVIRKGVPVEDSAVSQLEFERRVSAGSGH